MSIVEGFAAQSIFGLRGTEGRPAAGTNGDANIFDRVMPRVRARRRNSRWEAPRLADA